MNTILLTTKLTISDFIKVNYYLLYRKWSIKFITGIGILLLLVVVFNFKDATSFPWYPLLMGLIFTVLIPVQVYFSAKKNYQSNTRLSETIQYEFDRQYIQITGESFNSKLTWDKIYSVTENKDWILIWLNRQVANVIHKRDFKNDELLIFKEIVNAQTGFKNKLRK